MDMPTARRPVAIALWSRQRQRAEAPTAELRALREELAKSSRSSLDWRLAEPARGEAGEISRYELFALISQRDDEFSGSLSDMQILANALPGFRDMRAPLTAGYLWLVFAWLVAKPDASRPPGNPIARSAFELATGVGPIWVGIAVGTLAYFVGSASASEAFSHPAISSSIFRKAASFVQLLPFASSS